MIYQLKILLKDTKPPIWRRLHVHKDMLLTDLHETIQIAFDWMDMHLHCFEPRKTNGYSLTDRFIQIGTNHEDFFDMVDYDYDENDEKLSNWLVREQDKLVYVYDFGDDWRHEIVLEKILAPEPGRAYPYCVKVMRGPAMEDSGGFVEKAEEVDPEELREVINLQLEDLASEVEDIPAPPFAKANWSRLLELTKGFSKLAPWRWMADDEIFAVEIPHSHEFAYCSIMGAMGEEFGLAAFIGDQGLDYLTGILENTKRNEELFYDNRSITLSFCNREELTPEDYEIIKEAGFTFRGKLQWPMFRSLTPGFFPWYLTEHEIELFSAILERAIEVCARAAEDLQLPPFGTEEFIFAQAMEDGRWVDSEVPIKEERVQEDIPFLVDELALQRIKSYKRVNISIEMGLLMNPDPVQEEPNSRPYFPLILIGAERKQQMIVFHDMFPPENKEKQVQESFLKLLDQLQGVPRELWMSDEMFFMLKPVVDKLNTKVMQVKRLPIIEDVKAGMAQFFR